MFMKSLQALELIWIFLDVLYLAPRGISINKTEK